jgi:hypothetical protein
MVYGVEDVREGGVVFERILTRIREKIRAQQYVVTIHADEEMDNDLLLWSDVEHALLTGKIIERQKDRDTNEWKYVVWGEIGVGRRIGVVTKLSPSGKVVILTVYDAEKELSNGV